MRVGDGRWLPGYPRTVTDHAVDRYMERVVPSITRGLAMRQLQEPDELTFIEHEEGTDQSFWRATHFGLERWFVLVVSDDGEVRTVLDWHRFQSRKRRRTRAPRSASRSP